MTRDTFKAKGSPSRPIYWMGEEIKSTERLIQIIKDECGKAMDHMSVVTPEMVNTYKMAYATCAPSYTEDMKIAHAMEVALR